MGTRRAAIVTALVLVLAPVARLACAAACAVPHATRSASHAHCTGASVTAGAADTRWSPCDRPGCADVHAAATSAPSARVGHDDESLAIVSRPEPVGLAAPGPPRPTRQPPPIIGPPGYAGHTQPLRI